MEHEFSWGMPSRYQSILLFLSNFSFQQFNLLCSNFACKQNFNEQTKYNSNFEYNIMQSIQIIYHISWLA